MAKTLYFRHTMTGRKFRVVSIDKTKNEVTLRGEHAEFTHPYDKAQIKQMGYVLDVEE